MRRVWRQFASDWPPLLAVSFIALLPFRRLSEVPLSIFALSLVWLARSPVHRARIRAASRFVLPLFLCYWIPMLLSCFDSVNPDKSWHQTATALRFLAAALALSVLLEAPSARERLLRWSAWLLLLWAFDAFIQQFFGRDLFGIPMHPDRLNALFYERYQFFGPTLAMLSPLALEHARRCWRPWAWELSFALLLGAVLISGMRAGWLAMAVVLVTYMILMVRRENRQLRRALLTIPALAAVVLLFSYLASPLLQERLDVSRAFTFGTGQAADTSSMERIPIFRAALEMYRDHPVNGVGVRAYPYAYIGYAEPGDIHVAKSDGRQAASHAHNIVLEVMADTGTIGLVGLVMSFAFALRRTRRLAPGERRDAFPFALAVLLVVFPLNSHFAIYGTYTSSLIWFLIGLWSAALRHDRNG
jgi:O-antigen ligase